MASPSQYSFSIYQFRFSLSYSWLERKLRIPRLRRASFSPSRRKDEAKTAFHETESVGKNPVVNSRLPRHPLEEPLFTDRSLDFPGKKGKNEIRNGTVRHNRLCSGLPQILLHRGVPHHSQHALHEILPGREGLLPPAEKKTHIELFDGIRKKEPLGLSVPLKHSEVRDGIHSGLRKHCQCILPIIHQNEHDGLLEQSEDSLVNLYGSSFGTSMRIRKEKGRIVGGNPYGPEPSRKFFFEERRFRKLFSLRGESEEKNCPENKRSSPQKHEEKRAKAFSAGERLYEIFHNSRPPEILAQKGQRNRHERNDTP